MVHLVEMTLAMIAMLLIIWFLSSLIITVLISVSNKGFKKEWEDIGYLNLFKIIVDATILILSPIRFLYRVIKMSFMDDIDREIHERQQRIKYLEKARKKIEVLNDVKRKEAIITKKFLEETDEVDIEAHKLGLEVPHEREYE